MTRRRRVLAILIAAAVVPGTLGASAAVGHAVPGGNRAEAAPAGRAAVASSTARPGTNLVLNPGAEAGSSSKHGWATVTIPGWRVGSGLPTVVRYGNAGFPGRRGPGPRRRGRQMFVGGAGGTSTVTQTISLQAPSGGPLPSGTRFRLSAWLGGSATSHASVVVRFVTGGQHLLASWRTPAVSKAERTRAAGLHKRAVTGRIPSAARSARITIRLGTSLTNADGYNAPLVGYNHAVADGIRFSVTAAARRVGALVPPVSRVPRFDHVFLYFFENQDYSKIIGNTTQAPFFNSLLSRGALLADTFAEEHPSDGNYLAIAGGSTFGIPLTDPLEENSTYTIDRRNLGDLIGAAHESWKDYAQGANGPCDDTVHGAYWNDDPEFMYFRDVRSRPMYCAKHLVPLTEMYTDLEHTATTPSFDWVEPDDCTDMEGCGIAAGDQFLKTTLGRIENSPAWKTQRSLVIVTFDEDAYDHEHPAQRVATVVLGSKDVRAGYVSHVRYTHYSLLRTIEAALGLGTLTDNDRYAQPLNDVFHATP